VEGKELNSNSDFDVLRQAEDILGRNTDCSETFLWPHVKEWRDLPSEARFLHKVSRALEDEIPRQFREAVERQKWRRALFLLMAFHSRPFLPIKRVEQDSFDDYFYEMEIAEFINKARVWVAEVMELLQ